MHDGTRGRGADWFLAHFKLEEDNTMGIQTPPSKEFKDQTGWTQGGCLAVIVIACVTLVLLCGIVVVGSR